VHSSPTKKATEKEAVKPGSEFKPKRLRKEETKGD
jgi:hypothetical protein